MASISTPVCAVVAALAFSYLVGMVGAVLGIGPDPAAHGAFVLRSTLAVAVVDGDGKELIRSATTTFHMLRAAVGAPVPAPRSP